MKHVTLLLLIFFLGVSPSFSGLAVGTSIIKESDGFSPQDITLGDDAYHGNGLLPFTEWWYFDAMFGNGYSAQMSIRIISSFGKGYAFERLDLYKDGVLITHNSTSCRLREIAASSEIPLVQIHGATKLAGSYNDTLKNFVYDVSFDFPGNAAELHFVGCTEGWKAQHQSGDWWAVILPRAMVTGTITFDNTTLDVEGTGYHDHNWDVSGRSCVNFGWFWGKFNSHNYTATWSAILSTRSTPQPIMIVNIKNAGYITIPSETIWFSAKNLHLNHLMLIPHFFVIETVTETVFLTVSMEVIDVDYTRFMGFINYWRYHVQCSGTFMVDGHPETVDGVFIAEYIRFR
jgi:hypothetical protein